MRNAAICCAVSLIMACASVMAQEVKPSTGPARPGKGEIPLMLNIAKDRYDSRVGLDYSIRWDFSDFENIRPDIRTLLGSITAVGKWDITENTRVKYYGFSVNPWRLILAKEKTAAAPAGSSIKGESGTPEYKKRLRLSVSPLVDDIKRDLDESLRNILLEASFSGLTPQWRKVSRREKKKFFKDVLSLDLWGVPGFDETKKGIEYISK